MAGLLDSPLIFYSNPSNATVPIDGLQFQYLVHLDTKPNGGCQVEVDLDCWLDFEHIAIEVNGNQIKKFSNNQFLAQLANQEACHSDDTVYDFAEFVATMQTSEGSYKRSIYTGQLIHTSKTIILLAKQLISDYEANYS